MAKKEIATKITIQNLATVIKDTLAYKSDIPTNVSDLNNDSNFQDATQVQNAINAKIASVYKPGGSVAFEDLPSLSAANEGFVYNITNSFTTTEDFVEGAGKKYKAGADIGIVNAGTAETPVYKYNVFANFVDLSGYVEKVTGATAGNIATLNADGSISDGGIAAANLIVADDLEDYTVAEIRALLARS